MLQVINRAPSFGGSLGAAFGTGIGSGLEALAETKLRQLQSQNFNQALNAILGGGNIPEVAGNQSVEGQSSAMASPGGVPNFSTAGLNPKQQQDLLKTAQEQRKFQQKERHFQAKETAKETAAKFKETKALREGLVNDAKTARTTLHDLDRLEELEKSGKLNTAGYEEFLKNAGLDIPALKNPESEEFQKITANFLKDAKNYFGGRVSNFEIESFLKTVPSLSNTPEGRKRIVANLKYINQAKLAYNEAFKEILKESKGVPPFDLAEKIDDKIEKKLEKLSEKFKKELEKPSPKGPNKVVTTAQSIAGKALGNLPQAAGQALLGFRLAGPTGGILGGLAGLGGVGAKQVLGL